MNTIIFLIKSIFSKRFTYQINVCRKKYLKIADTKNKKDYT